MLSGLAVVFVGGEDYAAIEQRLWLFALLGTTLSMLQLLMYHVLARQARRAVPLVWVALVAVVLAGRLAETANGLVLVVITVDVVLLAVLLALSMWRGRSRHRGHDEPPPADRDAVPASTAAERRTA